MPDDRQFAGIVTGTEDLTLNQYKQIVIDAGIIPIIPKDTVAYLFATLL